MKDEVAFKKLVRYSRTAELRQLGAFLYKIRCKWQHHTKQQKLRRKYYEMCKFS
jgi:hypothetical protein